MKLVVNGDQRSVASGATISELVAELGHDPSGRGVAVALNGDVVPRSGWTLTKLSEGDRVEVLAAVGGG